MARLVERIAFSGVDGRVLIIPLAVLIYVAVGQVIEFVEMAKEIFNEQEVDKHV